VQRFEYRVVSMADGRYTATLNEYGADGWELVSVAPDVHAVPAPPESGLPGAPKLGGKLGLAASKLGELEGRDPSAPEPGTTVTTLLWVLRRPLDED
jgi:hypothetical protein